MRKGILLSIVSGVVALILAELALQILNLPIQSNRDYQRKDLVWMEKNVVLNSAGYRDKEYPLEKSPGIFRIYALGDSYTYGWLVDNPDDTFPKIIERKSTDLGQSRVEVINAGSPGFSLGEMVNRFISEGKYYYPDLVILGINDDEANYTKTYRQPADNKLNKYIRSLHIYQITLGNYFKYKSEKENHDYVLKIYTDKDSSEWKKFSEQLLLVKSEASKINSKVALVLFPHIHPSRPKSKYDYYPFNEKFKEFGKANDMIIIDPLEEFLEYPAKEKLVVNPLDPHPTAQMNELVADSFFSQFNIDKYLQNLTPYTPKINTAQVSKINNFIGPYKLIRTIRSDSEIPWVYFETKNDSSTQNFPIKDRSSRQTNIYIDNLQTAKSFTHAGLPGATIEYHLYPKEEGIIKIPKKVYGFDVLGVNYIFALIVADDGNSSSEYVNTKSIIESDSGFVIKYNPDSNYHNFRVSLSVQTKQIDIAPDGSVENIIKSETLTKKIDEDSNAVFFPVTQKVSSWQVFSREPGKNETIAFVDGEMTKVSEITTDKEGITLKFLKKIKKGQEVKFALSKEFELDETIYIEYE